MMYAAWTADNDRAREEYDRVRAEETRPRKCRSGEHWLLAGNVGANGCCLTCRNIKAVERRGLPRRFRRKRIRLTPELEAEIVRLYSDGQSIAMVRRTLGCSQGLVFRALERSTVPTRTLAEAASLRWKRAA